MAYGLQGVEVLPVFLGRPYHCEYAMNFAANPLCWSHSPDTWELMVRGVVAPPKAPTGDALTVPPASGADAQALVDDLLNQQLEDQKKLNAKGVVSTWFDETAGAVVPTSESLSWLVWGAVGIGVFGLVALSGGRPRRYGR